MFNRLLIANRGEIACRIIRTAKRLGMHVIAIYSEIDNKALHVELADEAYCVGPPASNQSYLSIENIITVAKKSKAEAIHPGYGFLAENAAFAEQCQQANIIFVGPSPTAIRIMGDKIIAKKTMEQANIPVTPGYYGEKQDIKSLTQIASQIELPIIIKAAAGGGGKGMRLVTNLSDFEHELKGAKREALASFGNELIFLEKYISPARHIELQIFADQQGHIVHLFDRDCSTQRRHQKIIEEAPAPNLSTKTKANMAKAAIAAAETIQYSGAGTIEFLVDLQENFYFMEMNTRLQVEHPVTEMITGIDLVEWQLRIAAGESLPLTQNEIVANGHAIEARIYAEDPFNHYMPSTGKLNHFLPPTTSKNVRLDTGFRQFDIISPFYDSMLAKLIVYAKDRQHAISLLENNLNHFIITGVKTNIGLLSAISRNHVYKNKIITTDYLQSHLNELSNNKITPEKLIAASSVCYLNHLNKFSQQHAQSSEDPNSPWFYRDNWRLDQKQQNHLTLWSNGTAISADIQYDKNSYQIAINASHFDIHLEKQQQYQYNLSVNQTQIEIIALFEETVIHIFFQGFYYPFWLRSPKILHGQAMATNAQLISPMPGTIVDVLVKPKQKVKKGDKLIIIEAMKMEHTLIAPDDGIISQVFFQVGDIIHEGTELLEFSAK